MKVLVVVLMSMMMVVESSLSTVDDQVYVGNGCFWALQHLIVSEVEYDENVTAVTVRYHPLILLINLSLSLSMLVYRSLYLYLSLTHSLTHSITHSITHSRTQKGYAGGKNKSRLCYHNANGTDDYGEYGHAEVVMVDVGSEDKALLLFKTYFEKSFVAYNATTFTRPDVYDLGQEYRAVIGVPGGVRSSKYVSLIQQANLHKMKLIEGKGSSDPDTLDTNSIYVYDSDRFPFTQAELCMQFHDDPPALRGPFPDSYHNLKKSLISTGRLHSTTCPPPFVSC